jgi:hypothetical protein
MRKPMYNLILCLSALLLLLLLCLLPLFLKENVYEWVFIYYMSYDNDLNPFGRTILNDLRKGIINSKIAVAVQTDFIDSKGMKRIGLYYSNGKSQRQEIILKSEDSADPAELRKYLKWVHKNFKANNYCIIFLNHGGTLNNMCLDQKPFKNQNENKQFASGKWLNANEVGKILREFNQKTDGKVRLLFLQQCARATIQNLYNFADAAPYIMASPLRVDAPNTYYTKTLTSVANNPNITGQTIAKTIMQEDEHYTLYTLINNNELKKLPEKLRPVLNSFNQSPKLNQPESCYPIFEFESEKFYDLKSFFQALSSANNNIASEELSRFFNWCDSQLIVSKEHRNLDPSTESPYFGLSIYVPSSQNDIGLYRFLPLYQQTNLEHTMKLLFE